MYLMRSGFGSVNAIIGIVKVSISLWRKCEKFPFGHLSEGELYYIRFMFIAVVDSIFGVKRCELIEILADVGQAVVGGLIS